jgi:hypothetical protein
MPAHLFGLEVLDLCLRCDGGVNIAIGRRQILGFHHRLRRNRGGPRGGGQRSRPGGESEREFQKVTAFHDISLFGSSDVMRRNFGCADMNGR